MGQTLQHKRGATLLLGLVLILLMAACVNSPKSKAREWADLFPLEIGNWESEGDHLELTSENQTNYGQITLLYEGENDTTATLKIKTYATTNAAQVALAEEIRNWELSGGRFERERIQAVPFDTATLPGGRVAYYQDKETVMMISFVAADASAELPEEDITQLLETIVAIIKNKE